MNTKAMSAWIPVLLTAWALAACTFDTAGLQEVSQNNVNNVNNVNNINNVNNVNNINNINNINNVNNLTCGNDLIEGTETCDGTDLAGQTCQTLGYLSGALACRADCTNFDVSACVGATCGNALIEGIELCDGDNLAGNTCAGLGFASGDLACALDCLSFDTSGCTMCGNDAIDGDELCDGDNLAGNTCTGLGFAAGDLACEADCSGFDTSGCSAQVCGNGHVEGDEVCDGADLDGQTCASQGFYGGTLACNPNCTAFITSGCNLCGNGAIDGPEACDGENLNGQSCQTLGCRLPGTLLCNANCNAFIMLGCWASHDEDGDGVDDNCDNCPTYANSNQANADNDQVGNVCESPTSGTAPSLATIHTFESLFNGTTTWTTVRGTWTTAPDQVGGLAAVDSDANYLHPLNLANNNYSVEVNYFLRPTTSIGSSWSGVIFGWVTSGGNLSSAYECVFDRTSRELQIWKYTTYNNYGWVERTQTVINTTANETHHRKMRAFVSGTTVRCVYSDATGATADLSWTDPYFSSTNGFSGKAGLRLYNESANFTSFIYYTN